MDSPFPWSLCSRVRMGECNLISMHLAMHLALVWFHVFILILSVLCGMLG